MLQIISTSEDHQPHIPLKYMMFATSSQWRFFIFLLIIFRMDRNYTASLSASEPKYYQFMFPEGVSNVLLSLTSDDNSCMSVSIQNLTVFFCTFISTFLMDLV